MEKLVDLYNEALARDIERLERLLIKTGDGQDESPLTIDLGSIEIPSPPANGEAKDGVCGVGSQNRGVDRPGAAGVLVWPERREARRSA